LLEKPRLQGEAFYCRKNSVLQIECGQLGLENP
jgi:hypothetical protein